MRVQQVQRMLPLAAWKFTEDIEHVHQLRVACRRTSAALEAFRPLMAKKPTALRSMLKRIRRAAGPARDTDVLLERYQSIPTSPPAVEYVIARLEQQRVDVQQQLVTVEKQARPKKIDRSLKQCLSLLEQGNKKQPTIGKFAKAALHEASLPVMELTKLKQPNLEQLHELRIAGKRLRYSIELFHSVFPQDLQAEFYPLVEKLQSRLGKINDHATAQAMFQRWLSQMPVGSHAADLAACIVAEHKAAIELREEFLAWWTTKRIAQLEVFLGSI